MFTFKMMVAILLWRLAGIGGADFSKSPPCEETPVKGSIVWLPANFVSALFDQSLSGDEVVECEILGTKITGLSQCSGSLVASIDGSQSLTDIRCVMKGRIESENEGINGPAKILSTASTSFDAIKRVRFDGSRFTTSPVELHVETSLQITHIDTHLTGIKAVVVKRIASAQADATKEDVRVIAEELTKKRLAEKIDGEFELQLSEANRVIQVLKSSLNYLGIREIRMVTRGVAQNLEVGIVVANTH